MMGDSLDDHCLNDAMLVFCNGCREMVDPEGPCKCDYDGLEEDYFDSYCHKTEGKK